jgi:hypothetical protein
LVWYETSSLLVIPAKAGIQYKIDIIFFFWTPAFAGVTRNNINFYGMRLQSFMIVQTGGTPVGPLDAGSASGMTSKKCREDINGAKNFFLQFVFHVFNRGVRLRRYHRTRRHPG